MSMQHSPGKIYLADDRGLLDNDQHRRYSTFNFGQYQQEHKQPFDSLHTFNDEILTAGGKLEQAATVDGYLLLIPVTGAIVYGQQGQSLEAEAGAVLLVPVFKGAVFEITNPYPSDWVNFLQIEIQGSPWVSAGLQTFNFDVEQTVNQLIAVTPPGAGLPFALHIGRFGGREEAVHQLNEGYTMFAFVIGGAFELQNRLLHERDGLALWDAPEIEAEALSNGAVLLLLELSE